LPRHRSADEPDFEALVKRNDYSSGSYKECGFSSCGPTQSEKKKEEKYLLGTGEEESDFQTGHFTQFSRRP
jgi:hypothetical protein